MSQRRAPAGSPDGGQFAAGDSRRTEAGQVDVFGSDGCPMCGQAKTHCRGHGDFDHSTEIPASELRIGDEVFDMGRVTGIRRNDDGMDIDFDGGMMHRTVSGDTPMSTLRAVRHPRDDRYEHSVHALRYYEGDLYRQKLAELHGYEMSDISARHVTMTDPDTGDSIEVQVQQRPLDATEVMAEGVALVQRAREDGWAREFAEARRFERFLGDRVDLYLYGGGEK